MEFEELQTIASSLYRQLSAACERAVSLDRQHILLTLTLVEADVLQASLNFTYGADDDAKTSTPRPAGSRRAGEETPP